MFVVESIQDLWNHIAYVMAYAPDQFPPEDFLTEDKQMNLDRAFEKLHQGIEIAYSGPSHSSKRVLLSSILDRSYLAYKAGDGTVAGHFLNEFQDKIFKID